VSPITVGLLLRAIELLPSRQASRSRLGEDEFDRSQMRTGKARGADASTQHVPTQMFAPMRMPGEPSSAGSRLEGNRSRNAVS
jgi:hypothetical protein